jgi:acyl-CoA reductase-like NAD-dependent aldehyde dehydrogenase
MTTDTVALDQEVHELLSRLGVAEEKYAQGEIVVRSPITGQVIARVAKTTESASGDAIAAAHAAFLEWRNVPAPRRGELVRVLGEQLRAEIETLGRLVTIETGKLLSEGYGEVQEMIDICGFAAGLSRQLAGLTIASERANHRMMETWHPLGVVGVISAFNFPVAVWSWNAALALVCGNAVVWKPSEKTPLTALATHALFERAAAKVGNVPSGLCALLVGDVGLGEMLVDDARISLVSATGSTAMGRAVAPKLAKRFARAILELGGNNAAIVCPSADLDLALRGIAFSAMGTAGQRCTSLRRLIVHETIYDDLVGRLKSVYLSVVVGDPRAEGTLVGPLIDGRSFSSRRGETRWGCGYWRRSRRRGRNARRILCSASAGGDGGTNRGGEARDVCAHSVRTEVSRARGGHSVAERRAPGIIVFHLHVECARGGAIRFGEWFGLRHRERKYWHIGRGDWRSVWWREGDRRRARVRVGCLETVHAARYEHHQLWNGFAAGTRREFRHYRLANKFRSR